MTPTRPPESAPAPQAAGFWQRELAWLLDAALLGVGVHLLLALWSALPLPWPAALERDALRALLERALVLLLDPLAAPLALHALLRALLAVLGWMTVLATVAYALLAMPYFVLQEAGPYRASLGKRALGLVVADRRGGALGPGRASARHLAATLSWISLNLGHALAAWSPSRQALHDRLSGTRVLARSPRLPGWGRALVGVQIVLLLLPPLLVLLLLAAGALT